MAFLLRLNEDESIALEDESGKTIARIRARTRHGKHGKRFEVTVDALEEINIEHEGANDFRPEVGTTTPRE